MADARCSQASTGSNIGDICGVIKGSDCVMCYDLKMEFESVLQELSTARKIIQILQDDVKKEAKDRTAIPEDHQGVKDILQSVNSQCASEEAGQICRSQKIHKVKTKHYTNHGFHLNKKGKDVLARTMGNLINKLLFEEDKGNMIITLNWNSDITKSAITQVAHCIPRNSTLENSDKTTNRSSTRQKKQPVTRKNYFLWPKV